MARKNLYPLISCICVTDSRTEFLLKAIICFDGQNYPNKELVISCPHSDGDTINMVSQIQDVTDLNVLLVIRENDNTLGSARNDAIKKCNGEYICIWDDDDWHREVRLMYQFTILRSFKQKREASILSRIILYNRLENLACISDLHTWPGTLLCLKELILKHPYLDTNHSEEVDIIQYLRSSKYLHYYDEHNIYAYIYHGNNQISGRDFSRFMSGKQLIDESSKIWLLQRVNKKAVLL